MHISVYLILFMFDKNTITFFKNKMSRISVLMTKILIVSLFIVSNACSKNGTPCVKTVWFQDKDGDGKGNKTVSVTECDAPAGYVSNAEDDDDNIAAKIEKVIPASGYTSPTTYPNLKLIWADEFTGTSLNEANWNYEAGNNNGWGNNELQFYKKENTEVRDGNLIITAKRETVNGFNFTSSRLTTQNKFNFKFGRVDIRAALPKGQGIWPALWMLGKDISSVGWPKCGEIDIMEMIGGDASGRDNTVHGTAHWDNSGTTASYGGSSKLNSGIYNGAFYVFSIVWDAKKIVWYVNDVKYHEIDITPQGLSELLNENFLLVNLAVGGNWPGNPDGTTSFPQYFVVDYIRVFQ